MDSLEFDVHVTPPTSASVPHRVFPGHPGHPLIGSVVLLVSSGVVSVMCAVVSTLSGKKLARDKIPDKYISVRWTKWRGKQSFHPGLGHTKRKAK